MAIFQVCSNHGPLKFQSDIQRYSDIINNIILH